MNLNIQKSTLVAGVSGVFAAFMMIVINNIPAPFKPVPSPDYQELKTLQSELAASRSRLDELKIKTLTNQDFAFTSWEQSGEINEDTVQAGLVTDTDNTGADDVIARVEDEQNDDAVATPSPFAVSEDQDWVTTTEAKIVSEFHSINPAYSQLLGTQCGHDACQVEVRHEDPEAAIQFLASISASDLIFSKEGYFQKFENEDGSSRSVFHFSREQEL